MTISYKQFPIPTSYFGIVLGLAALSMAWHHAQAIEPQYATTISNILGITAIAIWLLFIAIFMVKLIKHFSLVKAEWQHSSQFAFLSLIFISTMVIGDVIYRWHPALGISILAVAAIGQFIFTLSRVTPLWYGCCFNDEAISPSFYLPVVAANFTVASSLAMLGYADFGMFFFGAGGFSWIMFEPVLLQRMRTATINLALRPTLGIILAPAFVGSAAYLAVNGGEIDLLVKLMWGYGFLQLFYLLRTLPWILQNSFQIGLWSFSFGLASMANSAIYFYEYEPFRLLALITFYFANIAFILLIAGTIKKVIQGKFWAQ